MENNTPKHFVLQLGSLISLYISLGFLLALIFGLINLLFPDATDSIWQIESASSSVRLGIAMVLVFFPTYLILTRLVNQNRRKAGGHDYPNFTKWLIYLSLLVGGGVLLGDLVAIIMMFLEGEITQRFLLKALAVLLVVGSAFHYYILDARGYWIKHQDTSIMYAIGVGLFVLVVLAYGFANIDTPSEVREQKLDATQVQDLQEMQWRIQEYVMLNDTLPESLDALYAEQGIPVPTAPEDRAAYRYERTAEGFALCATFATPSRNEFLSTARPIMSEDEMKQIINPDNWEHGAGEVCFDRVVR